MTSKLVGADCEEYCKYFDGDCYVSLHNENAFVLLANIEQMGIVGPHCDAVFALLNKENIPDIFLIELKETSKTTIDVFTDKILEKNKLKDKGENSLKTVRSLLKERFVLSNRVRMSFVAIISRGTLEELLKNYALSERVLASHFPRIGRGSFDRVIITVCGHSLFNDGGMFIQFPKS